MVGGCLCVWAQVAMAYEGCSGQPPCTGERVLDLAIACEWPQELRGKVNPARAALLEGAISLVERAVRSRTITAAGTPLAATLLAFRASVPSLALPRASAIALGIKWPVVRHSPDASHALWLTDSVSLLCRSQRSERSVWGGTSGANGAARLCPSIHLRIRGLPRGLCRTRRSEW